MERCQVLLFLVVFGTSSIFLMVPASVDAACLSDQLVAFEAEESDCSLNSVKKKTSLLSGVFHGKATKIKRQPVKYGSFNPARGSALSAKGLERSVSTKGYGRSIGFSKK